MENLISLKLELVESDLYIGVIATGNWLREKITVSYILAEQ